MTNVVTNSFILGMTRTEGEWIWHSDKSKVKWTKWAENANQNDSGRNCAYMDITTVSVYGYWIDFNCGTPGLSVPLSLVCQRNPGMWEIDNFFENNVNFWHFFILFKWQFSGG